MKAELQKKLFDKYPHFFEYLNEHTDSIILPMQFGIECFPQNTLILGEKNKNIEDFNIYDNLFGESGIQKILNKFEKNYNGKLIKIEASGILPIYTTPEHPILTVTSNGKYRPTEIIFNYKKASKIEPKIRHKKGGDYLSIPILNGTDETTFLDITKFRKKQKSGVLKIKSLILDDDISWFFGLYVAEGSIYNGGIQISLHEKEIKIVNKIKTIFNKLGYGVFIRKQKKSKGIVVSISCKTLSRMFDFYCGHLAENKQIPSFIINNINLSFLKNFLDGYIEGDGSKYNSYGKIIGIKAVTVSKILALQLQLAYAKFKKFARITFIKSGKIQILGKKCNALTKYSISINYNINTDILIINNKIIVPIRKISNIDYNGKVFNFTTEDNTYIVNNIIVHNCNSGWYFLLDRLMGNITSYMKQQNERKIIKNKILRYIFRWDFFIFKWLGKFKQGRKIVSKLLKFAWRFKETNPEPIKVDVIQIKEKFGGLRFYIHGGDKYINNIVSYTEHLSYYTCEKCGTHENVGRTNGWIITLCDKCVKGHNLEHTWQKIDN